MSEKCASLKIPACETILNTFYIEVRRSSTMFKFNPSQKWKALFEWASTYKGEL